MVGSYWLNRKYFVLISRFRTGDIGQIEENGAIKIIDRKKDLVKLQFGEYVSLGKVESVLKTCALVENVCVYGDSSKSYVVALVCPDRTNIERLAAKLNKSDLDFSKLCNDRDMVSVILYKSALQIPDCRSGLF